MISSWIIRKRNWKIPDLYVGNSSGIYWYTMGMNWRAFLAWTMGIWPSFRESSNFGSDLLLTGYIAGFIIATGGATMKNPAWLRLFQTAWFVGFLGSSVVYFAVAMISPPPGHPYGSELFGNEHDSISVIDGQSPSGSNTPNKTGKGGHSPDLKAIQV